MKSNPIELITKIDNFHKLSGIVNIPPDVLKQVEDWAVGYYSSYIVRELSKKIQAHKDRLYTVKYAEDELAYWSEGAGFIENFIANNDAASFDQLYRWKSKRTRPTIYYFDEDAMDPKS